MSDVLSCPAVCWCSQNLPQGGKSTILMDRIFRAIAGFMRNKILHPLFFIIVLLLTIVACNAPWMAPRSQSVMTAEDLRQTVEAMPTFTPAGTQTLAPSPSQNQPDTFTPPTPYPEMIGSEIEYFTQSGDTLAGLAGRFGVEPGEIAAQEPLPMEGYLIHDMTLTIPNHVGEVSSSRWLLPDSELINSSTGFDVEAFVDDAGGYLIDHHEIVEDEDLTGVSIIQRVASEFSINPRLLLALLEYRGGWVFSHRVGAVDERYPIGFRIPGREGLYEELKITATQLNRGYYGWREGEGTTLQFENGVSLRLDPRLNAGTVALMRLFSVLVNPAGWEDDLYAPNGFPALHRNMVGNAWARDGDLGPLIPEGLTQPDLELPFFPGEAWSLTAGPHRVWNAGTPLGALDISPITAEEPCEVSYLWATASAPGIVVRAKDNVVALDLDGDGTEGSGWVLVYFHLADEGLVSDGSRVTTDQPLGHPSCEGGIASGTHVHIARKYNGEWLQADGPVPFVLSDWRVVAGERIYKGTFVKGDQVVTADPSGRSGSTIVR